MEEGEARAATLTQHPILLSLADSNESHQQRPSPHPGNTTYNDELYQSPNRQNVFWGDLYANAGSFESE